MLSGVFDTIERELSGGPVLLYGCLTFIVAAFAYWRSVRRTTRRDHEKDGDEGGDDIGRWYDSHVVFDLLIITSLVALLSGRIAYLAYRPELLDGVRWFWIPYERIDGVVFWFASLPWLGLRIWDGAVLADGFILGWLVSIVFFSRLMRISWGSISNAVTDFLWVWFVAFELYVALRFSISVSVGVIVILLLLAGLRWWSNRSKEKDPRSVFHKTVSVIWKTAVVLGVPVMMLITTMYYREESDKRLLFILAGVSILVAVWILAGDFLEYIQVLQVRPRASSKEEEGDSDRREHSGLSAVSGKEWKRMMVPDVQPRRDVSGGTPRNFSLSYRHFSRKWRDAVTVLYARIAHRKRSDQSLPHEETRRS